MNVRFLGAFLIAGAISISARADLFVDANVFYLSDGLKTAASTNTSTKTFYDFTLGFSVDKKGSFQIGWNYASYATSDTVAGVATTFSSTQMGPKFIYYFDKNRMWRSSFAYNLSTTSTYTPGGSTADKWKGTGLAADFGYQFRTGEGFSFGVRMNYSSTTFNESLIGTTYSTISNNRTLIYPSCAFTFDF